MKRTILTIIIIFIVSLSTNVFASAATTAAAMTASRTAATAAIMSNSRRRRKRINTVSKATEYIFKETQDEELKNYIEENKDYLYLDSKSEAEDVINTYNQSNLEETKQFIYDNYFDEEKPEKQRQAEKIGIIILLIVLSIAVILVFYCWRFCE